MNSRKCPPPARWEFEPYEPANHRRLAAVVEASYEQTLDCPELNGVREMDDVLAGYRASGVFDASRWLIAQYAGADVGCLLLSDFPEHDNWELVYMGVLPSAAGTRLGNGDGPLCPMASGPGGRRTAGASRRCTITRRPLASTRRPVFRPGSGARRSTSASSPHAHETENVLFLRPLWAFLARRRSASGMDSTGFPPGTGQRKIVFAR